MNRIVVNNSPVKRGSFTLSLISLIIQKREILAILGRMGSGRTVPPEAISGLFPGDTGSILFDGIDVWDISPGQRKLGFVYQDYGLFPHTKVKESTSYGLKMYGHSKKEQDNRAQGLMEILSILHIRDQYLGIPSGDESQRIALVRTLVPAPQILLLDEPFSVLDPAIWQPLHQELCQIHQHLDCVIIFITYDFLGTRTLAGRTAIPLEGELKTVTDTSRLVDGHFSVEVEGLLGRDQIITAPEC